MKKKYRDIHLSNSNKNRLDQINDIVDEYAADGYILTLRQLYYQLVTRDIIPNQQKEYAKLSTLLKEGRMAGVVDWDAIEDRLRKPKIPYYVSGIDAAIQDTIDQYRLNRQFDQPFYVEVWVEKDALSGVLSRITEYYHVRLMVNRGYSSVSAMHDAYKRFRQAIQNGQKARIIYLGDHDPSGIDMIRDIYDRIVEFGGKYFDPSDFDVKAIALTPQQVKKYNPPPNPAKMTDSRAMKYVAEHGRTSWEVDALNPRILNDLLTKNIEEYMDMSLFEAMIQQEEEDKEKLRNITF